MPASSLPQHTNQQAQTLAFEKNVTPASFREALDVLTVCLERAAHGRAAKKARVFP